MLPYRIEADDSHYEIRDASPALGRPYDSLHTEECKDYTCKGCVVRQSDISTASDVRSVINSGGRVLVLFDDIRTLVATLRSQILTPSETAMIRPLDDGFLRFSNGAVLVAATPFTPNRWRQQRFTRVWFVGKVEDHPLYNETVTCLLLTTSAPICKLKLNL